MIKTKITDGVTNNSAHVTDLHSLLVSNVGCPPLLEENKCDILREYLKTSAGSSDMKVDGSTTNVEFYISAIEGADRYITCTRNKWHRSLEPAATGTK